MVREASQAELLYTSAKASVPLLCLPRWGAPCRPVSKGVSPPPAPKLLSLCPCVAPSLCDLGQVCLSLCPSPHQRTGAGYSEGHMCTESRVTRRQDGRRHSLRPGRCPQSERAVSGLGFCLRCQNNDFLSVSGSSGQLAFGKGPSRGLVPLLPQPLTCSTTVGGGQSLPLSRPQSSPL